MFRVLALILIIMISTAFAQTPSGAKPPQTPAKPQKIDFFGRITNSDLKKRLERFLAALGVEPNNTGYIIISGSKTYAARREKSIRENMRRRESAFAPGILIERGVVGGKPLTEFWLIPAGSGRDEIKRGEN
jgi:hypothetical protein